MRKNHFGKFLGTLLLGFLSLTMANAKPWNKERVWKDGRAEVAAYDSERVVTGEVRKFKEQLITVREPLRIDTLVKADKPKKTKTIRVFKLNNVQKFETENYPYSYLTSVFVDAKNPDKVIKMSVGSQEWNGNTFKVYKRDLDTSSGTLTTFSYFDGEADQEFRIGVQETDLFEDQLPMSLRSLPFEVGYEKKIRLCRSLTSNHGGLPEIVEATLMVEGEDLVRCHVGAYPSWKVTLTSARGKDTYWFAKKSPHILTKMETADGRKRLLRGKARWSYWDSRFPKPKILQ